MSLGKKDIIKNISSKALTSSADSQNILDTFIYLIKDKLVDKNVKLSGFGSFYIKTSPKRIGRNPKTLQEFLIPSKKKVRFYSSCKAKRILN